MNDIVEAAASRLQLATIRVGKARRFAVTRSITVLASIAFVVVLSAGDATWDHTGIKFLFIELTP
jgi:hypothetical protein